MNTPNDQEPMEEESISNPLSSTSQPVEFQGMPYSLPYYNQPGPQPQPPLGASYQVPTHAAQFPAIRPFRMYNYLEAQGEDLSSRLYTLERDNLAWEVNDYLTREYRRLAQHNRPQFTTISEALPSHVNPQDVWRAGGHGQNQPQLYESVGTSHAEAFHITQPHDQPHGLEAPHQSPTIIPIAPPVAGSSTGPGTMQSPQRHRRRGASMSESKDKKRWFCEPCNSGPFFRKAEYDRHMKTSKAHKRHRSYEPEFQCGKCGRKFTRADAKMRHEKLCESKGKGKERESEGSEE
ncbi:hypothetical protein FRC12_019351 [Ceratobasidium sp. 428]|nr:hypothetical protein FRC12_019351 [Ceratobasidium sp. 428]